MGILGIVEKPSLGFNEGDFDIFRPKMQKILNFE